VSRPILLLLGLTLLAGCGGGDSGIIGATPQSGGPTGISFRQNPMGAPGWVSPCAGGQPQMQYNCPQNR
jgi:hypothetical protein